MKLKIQTKYDWFISVIKNISNSDEKYKWINSSLHNETNEDEDAGIVLSLRVGSRKICFYIKTFEIEYLKIWGSNIIDEMHQDFIQNEIDVNDIINWTMIRGII